MHHMSARVRGGRSWLKSSYFQALALARVDRLLRELCARRGTALVLNLHRVSPERNPYWAPMTPEAFERLVDYLAVNCRVLTLDELARSQPTAAARVVLSFDDGCRDFVEYAMPILDRRGLRVNHNVIAQSVIDGQPPWVIRVNDALNAATISRVRALRVPGFEWQLEGDDEPAKARFGTGLTGYLKSLPPASRAAACVDINALLDETEPAQFTPMMSRREVVAMAATHELGCHSFSHEAMAGLSDAEFVEDFTRCIDFFSQIERPMTIYAFPYGSFRPSQIETVKVGGIKHVLLVGERPTVVGSGVYTRITMYGDSAAELRMRAVGHPPGRPRVSA